MKGFFASNDAATLAASPDASPPSPARFPRTPRAAFLIANAPVSAKSSSSAPSRSMRRKRVYRERSLCGGIRRARARMGGGDSERARASSLARPSAVVARPTHLAEERDRLPEAAQPSDHLVDRQVDLDVGVCVVVGRAARAPPRARDDAAPDSSSALGSRPLTPAPRYAP